MKPVMRVFVQRACREQVRVLVTAECWEAVVEYVLMAWRYVARMPDWEDHSHNASKRQNYRHLAVQCMTALKKGGFDAEKMKEFCTK